MAAYDATVLSMQANVEACKIKAEEEMALRLRAEANVKGDLDKVRRELTQELEATKAELARVEADFEHMHEVYCRQEIEMKRKIMTKTRIGPVIRQVMENRGLAQEQKRNNIGQDRLDADDSAGLMTAPSAF